MVRDRDDPLNLFALIPAPIREVAPVRARLDPLLDDAPLC